MIVSTEGFVLKTIKYSETSLVCKVFTRELGQQSFLLQGVRKSKKGQAQLYRSGNFLEIVFYNKLGNRLNKVKEAKLAFMYNDVPFDVKKSALLLFVVELIGNAVRDEEEESELYEYLKNSVMFLDGSKGITHLFHIKFLLDFVAILGIAPANIGDNNRPYFNIKEGGYVLENKDLNVVLSLGASELIRATSRIKYMGLAGYRPTYDKRKEALNGLLRFLTYHLSSFDRLKSPDILETVLAP